MEDRARQLQADMDAQEARMRTMEVDKRQLEQEVQEAKAALFRC